ncbi:SH3 domain-containing protein [Citrus sinensis]|uniref:SH3 domain-containing protein n=1 Tax=Citrus sinensis TaxID=2711 RepID=A0ACB8KGX7_CITSI|nr:SH3 domain-containing protein [Citrus sinensis]
MELSSQHFQRNIVRGIEGLVAVSLKQMEIARKLAEDCCKYGAENQSDNSCVARAALQFGTSHDLMENERETLLGILGDQVSEPLRALINGAPLEDARHLTHRYDKLRHEVEAQVDAEKTYHQHVIAILEKLYAEVIHPFDDQANGELSLSIDDYVVVRQVAPTGWSEGECKGLAGWFPSAYVERQEKAPASKISEANSSP